MKNPNDKNKISSFWFGFFLGTSILASCALLFGTKKGRDILKKVLELSENFEENLSFLEKKLTEGLENKKEPPKPGTNLYSILKRIKIREKNTLIFHNI